MIRAALLALVVGCAPAHAEDVSELWVRNGGTGSGVVLEIVLGEQYVAKVIAYNGAFSTFQNGIFGTLVIDGFEVGITYSFTTNGYDDTPDTLHVLPPPGFYARPEQVEIPEGGWTEVLIYPELLG